MADIKPNWDQEDVPWCIKECPRWEQGCREGMYMGTRNACIPSFSMLERLKKDGGCDTCDQLRAEVERLKKSSTYWKTRFDNICDESEKVTKQCDIYKAKLEE